MSEKGRSSLRALHAFWLSSGDQKIFTFEIQINIGITSDRSGHGRLFISIKSTLSSLNLTQKWRR